MGILSSPLQSWQTLLSAADGRRRIQIYTSVSTSDPFAALLLYLLWCVARLYRDMPAPGLSDVQGLEGQDYPGKAQQGKKILGKAWQVQPREYNFQKLSSDFHLPHTHTSTPHTHKNTHSHKHTQRHIHTQAYTDIHTHTHRYIHKTHIHRHIDIHRHSIHMNLSCFIEGEFRDNLFHVPVSMENSMHIKTNKDWRLLREEKSEIWKTEIRIYSIMGQTQESWNEINV